MRKSKQNRKKKTSGTNLKTSPLKTYKKQVKRMKNRLEELKGEAYAGVPDVVSLLKAKYQVRLDGAEAYLRNYDKLQEQKKADLMKAASKK